MMSLLPTPVCYIYQPLIYTFLKTTEDISQFDYEIPLLLMIMLPLTDCHLLRRAATPSASC